MSNGHWRVGAALAGLALLYVVLGIGAFFGALNAPHYGYQQRHPTYRAADPEQGNPSQIDRDRAGLPYFAERIASGPDPQDTAEREKRDLAAQESMSVWAFWMLLVSAAGVVTTMLGTGFLLWQIMLTREAVKDTGDATKAMVRQNELTEAAQRPWLQIDAAPVSPFAIEDGEAVLSIDGIFRNVGHQVATDLIADATMDAGSMPASRRDTIIAGMRQRVAARRDNSDYNRRMVVPGGIARYGDSVRCKPVDEVVYRVFIYLEYRIEGAGEYKFAWADFSLYWKPLNAIRNITIHGGMLSPKDLVLEASGVGGAN